MFKKSISATCHFLILLASSHPSEVAVHSEELSSISPRARRSVFLSADPLSHQIIFPLPGDPTSSMEEVWVIP